MLNLDEPKPRRSVVRRLFMLLLISNAAMAVFSFLSGSRAGEPLSGHVAVNADRIRVLNGTGIPVSAAHSPAQPSNQICLEWGVFAGEEVERARLALEPLQLGNRLVQQNAKSDSGKWWVFIPPLRSKADADKKISELKNRGITDYMVIHEGNKWQNAVSLGLFSTEEAANKHLDSLRAKGVRTARIEQRGVDVSGTVFVVREAEGIEAKLVEMKLGFEGSKLQAVPCPPVAE